MKIKRRQLDLFFKGVGWLIVFGITSTLVSAGIEIIPDIYARDRVIAVVFLVFLAVMAIPFLCIARYLIKRGSDNLFFKLIKDSNDGTNLQIDIFEE